MIIIIVLVDIVYDYPLVLYDKNNKNHLLIVYGHIFHYESHLLFKYLQ
jgi:hypothetical protein